MSYRTRPVDELDGLYSNGFYFQPDLPAPKSAQYGLSMEDSTANRFRQFQLESANPVGGYLPLTPGTKPIVFDDEIRRSLQNKQVRPRNRAASTVERNRL